MSYFEEAGWELREYFLILCPEGGYEWLEPFIETPEMQRLKGLSQVCAVERLKLYRTHSYYNVLDHSVACALIVWHFTHDRQQTLAALFHDIATPAFKHCVDFLNGDAKTQESTEALTAEILANSAKIRRLLADEGLTPEEVSDYHRFPIADNDTPRLSADRLEYTLMNGRRMDYGVKIWLSDVKRFYQNLEIGRAADGAPELAFRDLKIAADFINYAHRLWPHWNNERFRLAGQGYADFLKRLIERRELSSAELYWLSDEEVTQRILESDFAEEFQGFLRADKIHYAKEKPKKLTRLSPVSFKGEHKYVVTDFPVKKRWIDPLVLSELRVDLRRGTEKRKYRRVSKLSAPAARQIRRYHARRAQKFAWVEI